MSKKLVIGEKEYIFPENWDEIEQTNWRNWERWKVWMKFYLIWVFKVIPVLLFYKWVWCDRLFVSLGFEKTLIFMLCVFLYLIPKALNNISNTIKTGNIELLKRLDIENKE